MSEEFSQSEIDAFRETLDRHAIQDERSIYFRCADRDGGELMKTIFWEERTDNHGMCHGPAAGFFEGNLINPSGSLTWRHNLEPAMIELVGNEQAKVESYFYYTAANPRDGQVTLACQRGSYRNLFEKRHSEWRVLHRTVVDDASTAYPYEAAWDLFDIAEDFSLAAFAPRDAIYAENW